MTTPTPNVDELVSAYLDGEAAPDEVALIEASEELQAKVAELQAVRELLGEPVRPAGDVREAHLSAALSAFDDLFGNATAAQDLAPDQSHDAPTLAAVPDPSESATDTVVHELPSEASPKPVAAPTSPTTPVVSLGAERERRRKRFSPGLIAAAAAALLLFVGITALSVGRSSNSDLADIATSTEADSAQASDGEDDAEDAMEEDAAGDAARPSLSEAPVDAAAPAPGEEPLNAFQAEPESEEEAMAEEAMDDEAMADEEESATSASDAGSADEAADDGADDAGDSAASSEADDASDRDDGDGSTELELTPLFLGEFASTDELIEVLSSTSHNTYRARAELGQAEGLFPSCQEATPELQDAPGATLVAKALVDGDPVEVHVVPADTLLILDEGACAVLEAVPLQS